MIKIKEKFKIVTRYRRRTKEEIVGRVMDVDEYLEKYKEFYFPTLVQSDIELGDEEFLDLDALICNCAWKALDLEKKYRTSKSKLGKKDISIDSRVVNLLMKCYTDIYSYRPDDEMYIEFVREQVDEYTGNLSLYSLDQNHFDLILPVMFFAMIVLNESQKETVADRAKDYRQDVEISWKNKSDPQLLSEYNLDYSDKNFNKEHRRIISKIRELMVETTTSKMCSGEEGPKKLVEAVDTLIDLAEGYENTRYCAEYARIGLFLRQILHATHDENRPMDTLLRTYMVVCLNCNLLPLVRFISSDMKDVEAWINRFTLLPHYFSKRDKKEDTSKCYLSLKESKDKNDLEYDQKVNTEEQMDSYPNLYNYLQKKVNINMENTLELIDFLAYEQVLNKYVNIDTHIKNFIKQIQKFIDYLPVLEKITKMSEVIKNIESLSESRHIKEVHEYYGEVSEGDSKDV